MSLFQCDECGCCENTALCHYAWRTYKGQSALCSACDPDIRKWAGRFERVFLPMGMFKTDKQGNLAHKETGDTDIRKYALAAQAKQTEGGG
jgi:hypothetical protein